MKYQDLPEKMKDEIRTERRYYHVEDEWWEYVYEDTVEIASCIGIRIEDIRFCFDYGGPGAIAFKGTYGYNANAVINLTEHLGPLPPEQLTTPLNALTAFVLKCRLIGSNDCPRASFSPSSYRSLDTTIDDIQTDAEETDYEAFEDRLGEAEEKVMDLIKALGNYALKNLRAEYEYLTSDEYIDESMHNTEVSLYPTGEIEHYG